MENSKSKLKHLLPPFYELKHLSASIDIKKLKEAYYLVKDSSVSVYDANNSLCKFHPKLAESVYGHFTQIPLTTQAARTESLTQVNEATEETTSINSFRRNLKLLSSPEYDEHTFTKETSVSKNSYFNFLKSLFASTPTRSRITILESSKKIPYHIDYDPSYAVRIIIPIITNKDVKNLFSVRNKEVETYLEEGKAYFLNTGVPHAVVNDSTESRVALMYSIQGTKDLIDAGLLS